MSRGSVVRDAVKTAVTTAAVAVAASNWGSINKEIIAAIAAAAAATVETVVAEEEKTKKEEMEWPLEPRLRHGSGIRYLRSQDM